KEEGTIYESSVEQNSTQTQDSNEETKERPIEPSPTSTTTIPLEESNSSVVEHETNTTEDNATKEEKIYVDNNTTKEYNSTLPEHNVTVEQNATGGDTPSIEDNTTFVEPIQEQNATQSSDNNTPSIEHNTTQESNTTQKNTEQNTTQENSTTTESESLSSGITPNIILIHGLIGGGSNWEYLAPKISHKIGKSGEYVEVGVEISIDDNQKCWDGDRDAYIACSRLSEITDQPTLRKLYRTLGEEHIYGLDRGQFTTSPSFWREYSSSYTTKIKANKIERFSNQRLFSINFSNSNQLTFYAQGYQLRNIMEEIVEVTGVDEFILVGHSMGGLASRAYIQNEYANTTHTIRQLITIGTPHLGGIGAGYYIDLFFIDDAQEPLNAGINLASDSLAYQRLNDSVNIADYYMGIELYHLGYSDGFNDGGEYYAQSDGNVEIGSQMGLDILNPYRVIFSPHINGVALYDKDTTQDDNEANEVLRVDNYTTDPTWLTLNGHMGMLQDSVVHEYILSILALD
ncbi:MAG: alpha/beta fold hydrolase, partial [Campylobacterota bacterium]|nr:alpha/beta fold hydrolase [Campylobacterota bacterium]